MAADRLGSSAVVSLGGKQNAKDCTSPLPAGSEADMSSVRDSALKELAEIWCIEDSEITQHEHGFDWLPGSHTVRVRIHKDIETPGPERFRMTMTTDYLRSLPSYDRMFVRHAGLVAKLHCPAYSLVYPPTDIVKKYHPDEPPRMYLFSSAYLYEDTGRWLAQFFARMSILQPIYAELQSINAPEIVGGGRPDFAGGSKRTMVNGILNVQRDVIIPEGKKPNSWIGSDEFAHFVEVHGQNEGCLGVGDKQGMTLQVPFGSQYAVINLRTDRPHRLLGNGLLIETEVLSYEDFDEACVDAAAMNFLESVDWSDFPIRLLASRRIL
jgi:hypothetical protein